MSAPKRLRQSEVPNKPIDRNVVITSNHSQRTSLAVAQAILPKTGSVRRAVYEYVLRSGLRGATDQEIGKALSISGDTIRPSRGSLVADGWITDSGTTRVNEKQHDCIVWRACDQGMMF